MLVRVPLFGSFLAASLFFSVFLCASARAQQSPGLPATTTESHWLPEGPAENIPPVDPAATCDLNEVLRKAGQRIQEFVRSVDRFTAREYLLQETINKSGKISGSEKRKYNYLVSINEIRPGILDVEEYLKGSSYSPDDQPGGITGITTRGLPALVLIFHPNYAVDFSMKCEGLATINGQPAWQIAFQQRADKPNRIRSYSFGSHGIPHPIPLKGRAWFVSDSYQIVSLRTDLIDALPDIRLSVDHTAIEYGPVHFAKRGEDLWLPQSAELYSDLKGKRIHQLMNFSDYLLFAVDQSQKISVPEPVPERVPESVSEPVPNPVPSPALNPLPKTAPSTLSLFFVPLSP